ncbi:uncharacterized protein LOC134709496 [Mytilus trossulus]|uniref:uncharacterized protein LOC134709496 n=1 Tax=Mytilus trossulus TaxID=6551 RepID=UPI0030072D4D
MDTSKTEEKFRKFLSRLSDKDELQFLGWLKNNIDDLLDEARDTCCKENDVILNSLRDDIRQSLPQNAVSATENIQTPTIGMNSDCDPATTVHVDAFLYDEETVDDLCDEGKMSRNYCQKCGSHDVKPLTFITHSASVPQIKYIYQYLLPDLRAKTVVDVGSRTGALLYGGYIFSNAEKLIGIEIDVSFCVLQKRMLNKYKMTDRVQILHKDVLNCTDVIKKADIIVLNNVFEFFMPKEVQERIWNYLYDTLKKTGTIIVTVPSMEDSISPLQTKVDLDKWVKKIDTSATLPHANLLLYGNEDHEDSDLENIFVYKVL